MEAGQQQNLQTREGTTWVTASQSLCLLKGISSVASKTISGVLTSGPGLLLTLTAFLTSGTSLWPLKHKQSTELVRSSPHTTPHLQLSRWHPGRQLQTCWLPPLLVLPTLAIPASVCPISPPSLLPSSAKKPSQLQSWSTALKGLLASTPVQMGPLVCLNHSLTCAWVGTALRECPGLSKGS